MRFTLERVAMVLRVISFRCIFDHFAWFGLFIHIFWVILSLSLAWFRWLLFVRTLSVLRAFKSSIPVVMAYFLCVFFIFSFCCCLLFCFCYFHRTPFLCKKFSLWNVYIFRWFDSRKCLLLLLIFLLLLLWLVVIFVTKWRVFSHSLVLYWSKGEVDGFWRR